jgi:DNA-directed RNA polymerase specialized sigma24 family protein
MATFFKFAASGTSIPFLGQAKRWMPSTQATLLAEMALLMQRPNVVSIINPPAAKMKNQTYTDLEIIERIVAGDPDDLMLDYLFRHSDLHNIVYRILGRYCKTREEKQFHFSEILENSIIGLYKTVRRPDFVLKNSIPGLFSGICSNKTYDYFVRWNKNNKLNTPLDEQHLDVEVQEPDYLSEMQDLLIPLIRTVPQPCQQLLIEHYFDGITGEKQ